MRKQLLLFVLSLTGMCASAQVGINDTFISDFEEWTDNWTSANGSAMPLSKADNPQNGGANTSAKVMKVEKSSTAQVYDGVFRNVSGITIGTGSADHRYFRAKVKAANTTDAIRFKVRATDNTEYGVDYTPTTTDWVEVALDMTQAVIAGSTTKIPEGTELNRVIINPRGAGTLYFDDIFLTDEETDVTYWLEIGEAGAATMVLPFETVAPSGVQVLAVKKTLKEDNVIDTYTLTNEAGILSRNNVALVVGAPGTYAFKANKINFNAYSKTMSTSGMTGVYEERTVPAGSYVVDSRDGVSGFYQADGTEKVKRFQAYLTLDPASDASVLSFGADVTTGIDAITQHPSSNPQYYNLAGQRVAQPKKGLYVINGKKVVL